MRICGKTCQLKLKRNRKNLTESGGAKQHINSLQNGTAAVKQRPRERCRIKRRCSSASADAAADDDSDDAGGGSAGGGAATSARICRVCGCPEATGVYFGVQACMPCKVRTYSYLVRACLCSASDQVMFLFDKCWHF